MSTHFTIEGYLESQELVKTDKGKERIDCIIEDINGGRHYLQSRKDTYQQVRELQPNCQRLFTFRNEMSERKLRDGHTKFYYNNLILEKIEL